MEHRAAGPEHPVDHHAHHQHAGHAPPSTVVGSTHASHSEPRGGASAHGAPDSLNQLAVSATIHCLTGCAIGEVMGMVIGTALGWGNGATTVLAIVLAFVFGYALTARPLLRAGLSARTAAGLALASDTASITIMEIVDTALMFAIPGAMDAGLRQPLFWGSLALSLVLAGAAAFPVNRWLIARGRGHAVVHQHHGH